MSRVKGAVVTRKRRSKVLKAAKGYWGAKSKHFKMAKQAVMKSGNYAYIGRKHRKRDFRLADIHMDFYAPAARPDGRCSGRPDEGHAVYDVLHATDVLLHLQRLLVRSELLLLHLAVHVRSHHVDPAQDHR